MGSDMERDREWLSGGDVMAAVDSEGTVTRLVIADVTRDDAWLSILESEALVLRAWQ